MQHEDAFDLCVHCSFANRSTFGRGLRPAHFVTSALDKAIELVAAFLYTSRWFMRDAAGSILCSFLQFLALRSVACQLDGKLLRVYASPTPHIPNRCSRIEITYPRTFQRRLPRTALKAWCGDLLLTAAQ